MLNAQLALDTFVTLSISTASAGAVTHDIEIVALNPTLIPVAGLAALDGADIFTEVTAGTPAQLVNSLDPVFAGQLTGAFTAGTDTLTLTTEIPAVTTTVTPISTPNVDFGFEGNFTLILTIVASGDQLVVDGAGCNFDVNDPPVECAVE